MNFRYKTIVFSLLMSGMTLVSCDDFLTQENIHQLTTQNFYKTIGDCEKGLAAVYNALKNTNIYHPLDENRRSDIAVEGNKDRKQFDNEAISKPLMIHTEQSVVNGLHCILVCSVRIRFWPV